MFELSSPGSFGKTDDWFYKIKNRRAYDKIESLAQEGLLALAAATPTDTGETARSWYYTVNYGVNTVTISWRNDHMAGATGTPVAILLQYGHGTGTGGYVEGVDFINPAIKPVMDKLASNVWKVVTS